MGRGGVSKGVGSVSRLAAPRAEAERAGGQASLSAYWVLAVLGLRLASSIFEGQPNGRGETEAHSGKNVVHRPEVTGRDE